MPLAQALAPRASPSAPPGAAPGAMAGPADIVLLSRCAHALECTGGAPELIRHYRELAAAEHEPHAQMAVGLWHARMQADGKRIGSRRRFRQLQESHPLAHPGKHEQGLAEAWYALSRIYVKPEFSQRNIADAQAYLERAAEMGHRDAQLECGNNAWRGRQVSTKATMCAPFTGCSWLPPRVASKPRQPC
ncbi:hypothetical protein LP420_18300 [Massilia sp. B-10]|nr:hypothetical protein LP420_18300 [Massilia sp. B-10]